MHTLEFKGRARLEIHIWELSTYMWHLRLDDTKKAWIRAMSINFDHIWFGDLFKKYLTAAKCGETITLYLRALNTMPSIFTATVSLSSMGQWGWAALRHFKIKGLRQREIDLSKIRTTQDFYFGFFSSHQKDEFRNADTYNSRIKLLTYRHFWYSDLSDIWERRQH